MVNREFRTSIQGLIFIQNTSRFLHLSHTKLEVYTTSREFTSECYKLTKALPDEEKYAMASQIRRAALSAHLNIAEGSSRKSEVERKRYYEIARVSVIEIDAALDVASDLNYLKNFNIEILGETMIKMFKLLSGMIESKHSLLTISIPPTP